MWNKNLEKRREVKNDYLLPKLYKLGYQDQKITSDHQQLVEKGKRKIYIEIELVVEIESQPAMVAAVRSSNEELTEYTKDQALFYARLLSNPAPVTIITNGVKTEVYDTYTKKELSSIPNKARLKELINKSNNLSTKEKEKALDEVFSSISLWDETKQKSTYYTKTMRPYGANNQKSNFNTEIFHNFNYRPNIITGEDQASIRVSSHQDLVNELYLYYTVDGSVPQGKAGQVKQGTKLELNYKYSEEDSDGSQVIDWWETKIPTQKKGSKVRYIIEGYNSNLDKSYFAEGKRKLKKATKFSYLVQDFKTPDWAKEAIVYQIMIDRFCDGDPDNNYDLSDEINAYQGGDLQGIINKLNYIKELGVTAIWLSPVYQGIGYHGYHITNFLRVDPHFGNKQLLKELITKAHQLDLKVILDFVPNHTSNQHRFFLAAQSDKESPYYDWYNFINWPNEYEKFCGIDELPSVNTDNPEVRNYIIYEQALHWLLDYDVDGFRLDYAFGPSHDFWTEFRKVIKEYKPEAYIFGEVWESPREIKKFEGELDGCFDFSIVWSFRELFIYESKSISEFIADLDYIDDYYDQEFILNRFLDNHDMDRFLWEAQGNKEKLKLAATCQFTLAGAQFIYYGTEVGLSQQEPCSDDNTGKIIFDNSREFMLWGAEQDKSLYNFYQQLCKIRNNHQALITGERQDLVVEDQNKIWVYSKYNNQEELLIILNLSTVEQNIDLSIDKLKENKRDKLVDLLTSEQYQLTNRRLQLQLEPQQKLILI